MLQRLLQTDDQFSLTMMRVILAVCIFPHGAQKLLGWFGGPGLSGAIAVFSHFYGMPAVLTVIAVCAEFFGGICLLLGFLGRLSALGLTITMIVASLETYHHVGNFFMNWFGKSKGEGIEYHLLAIALGLALTIRGSGALSIDRLLAAVRQPQQLKAKARSAYQSA
jgi:putative oxidoreductase